MFPLFIFQNKGVNGVVSPSAGSGGIDPTYSNYEVGFFKVIDNYVDTKLSANTGLSFDKSRRLIYSSVTPNSSGGIFAFDEDYVFQYDLGITSTQGHAYDAINDKIIVWQAGSLLTYAMNGTLEHTQASFDPMGDGSNPGTLTHDYVLDRLLFSVDNGSDIAIFSRSGTNWVFDSWLGAVNPQEGVTFDENDGCYWYNRTNEIVKISKSGTELGTIPQTDKTINVNEGLAFNPFKQTLYVNSDKGYHGSVTDGNRCVELWPGYYNL